MISLGWHELAKIENIVETKMQYQQDHIEKINKRGMSIKMRYYERKDEMQI